MSKIYRQMVKAIIRDVRNQDFDNADAFIQVFKLNHKIMTVKDEVNHGNVWDYNYTITNPKVMSADWLREKIIVTPSCQKLGVLDTDSFAGWLFDCVPKEMLMTLNKLVFIYNEEEDFDFLDENKHLIDSFPESVGDVLERHEELCDSECTGNCWVTDCICIIHLGNIVPRYKSKHGILWSYVNDEIFKTALHEIRHIAQANPYLPEKVLNRLSDDDEEDAEMYAQWIFEDEPGYCLTK